MKNYILDSLLEKVSLEQATLNKALRQPLQINSQNTQVN